MTEAIDRILRLPAVLKATGLSRSTLYRKINQGTFPKQIAISERCAGWRESAVNAWLTNPAHYASPKDTKVGPSLNAKAIGRPGSPAL